MGDIPSSRDLVGKDEPKEGDELDALGDLSPELEEEMKKLDEMFWVSREKLKEISEHFEKELDEGLQKEGQNIAMYVTWVLGFPTGKEKGEFLTVDLGGTNLRVCWIKLKGQKEDIDVTQDQYKLPDDIKTSTADKLWKFVAESIQTFIKDHDLKGTSDEPLHLGFTFSYPATQEYIDHGILQTWTKGFDIDNVEGNDVASQLREAISDLSLPVELIALINDTTGAMIASAYNDPDTIIGAIFGTGCNAAYMEDVGSIPKLASSKHSSSLSKSTPMAINCEYGAFDNAHKVLPLTAYDKQIDRDSPRPGEQAFEKMSAGLYLGELYRLIILDLHSRKLVFTSVSLDNTPFTKPYAIDTGFLSAIEDDTSPKLHDTASRFKDQLSLPITDQELVLSRRLAEMIAIRGARLCACGVAAICRKKNLQKGHVAADGSVANKHPKFKRRWGRALGEILDWDLSQGEMGDGEGRKEEEEGPIRLTSAEDGSGVGAAVIAAMTLERWRKGQDVGIRSLGQDV